MSRLLWLLTPGITSAIVESEAKRLGIISTVARAGENFDVTPKLATLTDDDSLRLRDACYARIGIEDAESFESERLRELPAFRAWAAERRRNPPMFRRKTE